MERAAKKKKLLWILERLNILKVKAKMNKLEMLNILKVKLLIHCLSIIANPTCTGRDETWNATGYLKEKRCMWKGKLLGDCRDLQGATRLKLMRNPIQERCKTLHAACWVFSLNTCWVFSLNTLVWLHLLPCGFMGNIVLPHMFLIGYFP